jgi:alkylation response protein AidB-like acyl-CoA dehydrogenase
MSDQQAQTTVMDESELESLRETVRGICARLWPSATAAPDGDLSPLWDAAVAQGWMDLGELELIPAALAIQEELGGLACPLPVLDVALVSILARSMGQTSIATEIAEGTIRPAFGLVHEGSLGESVASYVEAGGQLTHLAVIDEQGATFAWYGLDEAAITPTAGLAVPSWSTVQLVGQPSWTTSLADHEHLLLLRRLGLAARAAAAVRRTHELAVEHACRREQFGRFIGSFQAVSHRLVGVEMALTAARELQRHALTLLTSDDKQWRLAAQIYIENASSVLAQLQFDGHHTLAAVGYFDEHEAPWLFRRVHADLSVLGASATGFSVGAALIDHGARLPEFELGPEAEQVRLDVLEAFAPWSEGPPSHLGDWDDQARGVLRERDWIGVGWPVELGGGGYDVAKMLAFSEAIAYASPPVGNIWMGIDSIVPMLIKVGPPELRDMVMEEARGAALSIALGYSEPGSGSDLASLRTRADRVDGGWRVNGQKLWGTCVPDSKWIVLAARTDATSERPQAGISLFLVDLDSDGITVAQHHSLGGEISATTFWDDVFVPDERLIGEVDQGWSALSSALAAERVLIGASVMKARRAFDRLVDIAINQPERILPGRRADARRLIGDLAIELQAARGLVNAAVSAMTSGGGAGYEPSMAKVKATELAETLNATAISLLGPDALYAPGVPGSIADGIFEDGLRSSIMGVVAGGTGDIQRNLIARAMGLPR